MNREEGTFRRLQVDMKNSQALSRPVLRGTEPDWSDCFEWECGGVSFIHEDRDNMLWIGALNGGLNRYNPETGEIAHFEFQSHEFINDAFWTIYESHEGTLWVGNWGGMHKVTIPHFQFPHFEQHEGDPNSLGGLTVTAFHEGKDGTIWIGVGPNGIDRLDINTGRFHHFLPSSPGSGQIELGAIWALFEDNDGVLWMGGEKLTAYDPATGIARQYVHNPTNPSSLIHNSIRTLHEDREGRLLIGTDGGGLNVFDKQREAVVHYRHRTDDPQSLSDNYVHSILRDRTNTLWVGTGNGLNIFNPDINGFELWLPGKIISSLFEDYSGRLWVGTWGHGLFLKHPKENTFVNFTQERWIPD